jgi:hypothetical protein
VRSGAWRILVGKDAKTLDALVRSTHWCARSLRPPTTTPSWAEWRQKRQRQHLNGSDALQEAERIAVAETRVHPGQLKRLSARRLRSRLGRLV